jgi:predicted RNA-binding protein with PIN domain
MQDYLIIDGYNILFAWPDFEIIRNESLEFARTKLVEILTNYSALADEKIILVFDAYQTGNKESVDLISDKLKIIYSQQGETADSLIEKLVSSGISSGRVYVATSDWAEQSMIFGLGAYRITPLELLDRIKTLNREAYAHMVGNPPGNSYLENRLDNNIRETLERWRRERG